MEMHHENLIPFCKKLFFSLMLFFEPNFPRTSDEFLLMWLTLKLPLPLLEDFIT